MLEHYRNAMNMFYGNPNIKERFQTFLPLNIGIHKMVTPTEQYRNTMNMMLPLVSTTALTKHCKDTIDIFP